MARIRLQHRELIECSSRVGACAVSRRQAREHVRGVGSSRSAGSPRADSPLMVSRRSASSAGTRVQETADEPKGCAANRAPSSVRIKSNRRIPRTCREALTASAVARRPPGSRRCRARRRASRPPETEVAWEPTITIPSRVPRRGVKKLTPNCAGLSRGRFSAPRFEASWSVDVRRVASAIVRPQTPPRPPVSTGRRSAQRLAFRSVIARRGFRTASGNISRSRAATSGRGRAASGESRSSPRPCAAERARGHRAGRPAALEHVVVDGTASGRRRARRRARARGRGGCDAAVLAGRDRSPLRQPKKMRAVGGRSSSRPEVGVRRPARTPCSQSRLPRCGSGRGPFGIFEKSPRRAASARVEREWSVREARGGREGWRPGGNGWVLASRSGGEQSSERPRSRRRPVSRKGRSYRSSVRGWTAGLLAPHSRFTPERGRR